MFDLKLETTGNLAPVRQLDNRTSKQLVESFSRLLKNLLWFLSKMLLSVVCVAVCVGGCVGGWLHTFEKWWGSLGRHLAWLKAWGVGRSSFRPLCEEDALALGVPMAPLTLPMSVTLVLTHLLGAKISV